MAERITVNSKKPVSIKENLISHKRKTDFRSNSSPVNRILYLQRTIGNQAVQRLIKSGALQAKLKIGQPGDKYEQEADRVADAVMRMPEPGVQRQVEPEEEEETLQTKPLANQITPLVQVQRQEEPEEEEEMLQAKPLAEEITPLVQRQVEPEEEEEELQAKATSGRISEANPNLESDIQSIKGGGRPLSANESSFFEPRFGRDFSQVRLHMDTRAAESAKVVNARAFTVGTDVVFAAGQYAPGTSQGRRLMAHELAHVVQQNKTNIAQMKKNEKQSFDPQLDLEYILGSIPEGKSILYSEDKMLKLFKYLKTVRRSAQNYENIKSLLEAYFPTFGNEIWEQSKKPFASYVGTSKGAQAGKRLKVAMGLGLKKSTEGTWKKKFIGSDVIFFSGHHYARYGDPGEFEGLDVRKIKFTAPKVKLIMISSCAGLASNALKLWMKRFPNANILGWRFSSPLNQKGMMREFLLKLPDDLILEEKSGIKKVLDAWIKYVEGLTKDSKTIRPYGLGYATPDGKVAYMIKSKGMWKWKIK